MTHAPQPVVILVPVPVAPGDRGVEEGAASPLQSDPHR
jgi:hypothetical protein